MLFTVEKKRGLRCLKVLASDVCRLFFLPEKPQAKYLMSRIWKRPFQKVYLNVLDQARFKLLCFFKVQK